MRTMQKNALAQRNGCKSIFRRSNDTDLRHTHTHTHARHTYTRSESRSKWFCITNVSERYRINRRLSHLRKILIPVCIRCETCFAYRHEYMYSSSSSRHHIIASQHIAFQKGNVGEKKRPAKKFSSHRLCLCVRVCAALPFISLRQLNTAQVNETLSLTHKVCVCVRVFVTDKRGNASRPCAASPTLPSTRVFVVSFYYYFC